jgi:predicted ATPase
MDSVVGQWQAPPMSTAAAGACACDQQHDPRRVVLTGGPGAGKTAVLELVRATACRHVRVLPEAASVIFGGGFPRRDGFEERRAAQRAIFHVQRELEALGEAEGAAILLCDRGTLDGLAYWPGDPGDLWDAVHSSLDAELQRYAAVIHLRTPAASAGYNHANPRPHRVRRARGAHRRPDRSHVVHSSATVQHPRVR